MEISKTVLRFLGSEWLAGEKDATKYASFRSAVWAALIATTDISSLRELVWQILDASYHQAQDSFTYEGVFEMPITDGSGTVDIDGGLLLILKRAVERGDGMTAIFVLDGLVWTVYNDPRIDYPWELDASFGVTDNALMAALSVLGPTEKIGDWGYDFEWGRSLNASEKS
jgi:hypothetical protein